MGAGGFFREALFAELLMALSLCLMSLLLLGPLRRRTHAWQKAAGLTLLYLAARAMSVRFGGGAGPSGPVWLMGAALYAAALFVLCAECSRKAALYAAMWALMLQQLWVQLCLVSYWAALRVLEQPLWAMVCAVLAALLLILALALTLVRWMPDGDRYVIGPRQFAAALLSFSFFQSILLLSGYRAEALRLWESWPLDLLMELYCLTLIYLQHETFKKSAMRHELAMLNQLQMQQRQQYELARDTIAIINRKCHDLKHQMQAMRFVGQGVQREQYFEELEGAIRIYDAITKTGNEVLDTVLTEKSLICEANGIQAHCVADGKLLDFMDPVDLYTIFGNALDNAIEAVKKLESREQRVIDVMVYQEKQFLAIQVINPLATELRFNEEGLPLSTKLADGYHGFGLKSIRHTVGKYGGFVTVRPERDCFCLRILLPIEN